MGKDPVTAKVRISPGRAKGISFLSLPIRVCSLCWGNKNVQLFSAFFVFLHCRPCSLPHTIHNTQSSYKTALKPAAQATQSFLLSIINKSIKSHVVFSVHKIHFLHRKCRHKIKSCFLNTKVNSHHAFHYSYSIPLEKMQLFINITYIWGENYCRWKHASRVLLHL